MIHKITPQNNQLKKKVQFDSARVSFQVEYDIPDDRSLRNKIPVWTEHWKKSKSGLILQLLRSLSITQWLRVLVLFLCVSLLSLQIFQTIADFLRAETLITADYSLPLKPDFPSLSLCVPIALPFCNHTCAVRPLFNQSLSVFHRCKLVSHEHKVRVCSPPLQWIHGSKKCFTYTEEDDQDQTLRVELLVQWETQEEVQLFVHQKRSLPLDNTFAFVSVKRDKDVDISFFKTTVIQNKDCEEYSFGSFSHCFARCLLQPCVEHCVSRLAPIRADLLSSSAVFCRDLSSCDHSIDCLNECPKDCEKSNFQISLTEDNARDVSETNVSLRRQLTPDLTLRHTARITCLQLVARVGGLCAFWLFLFWLWSRTLHLVSIIVEVIDIYFS